MIQISDPDHSDPAEAELVSSAVVLVLSDAVGCCWMLSCPLLSAPCAQDEEEAEAAFNQKHALQKAKEVGPLSSFMSSE